MADEAKPDSTPAPAPETDQALIDRITAGVKAGVEAVIPKLNEQINARPVTTPSPVRPEPVVQLVRPSEEEVAEAMVDGNKAKVADLLRKQRAYDQNEQQRAFGNLTAQGGAAIGSIAKQAAATLPFYKRFKKEIDQMVDEYLAANPGTIGSYDIYERAHTIVRGNHTEELIEEAREEAIRKTREPEPDLLPEGRRQAPAEQPEPQSLQEALVGDWKREFRDKQRQVGGRSEDEELRKMGYREGFKDFITERKRNETIEDDTAGSFGLDRDWVWDNPEKTKGHYVN
jgi:hypothetical protein